MYKTSFAMALLGATLANAQGNSGDNSGPVDKEFLDWAASNNKNYSDAQSFANHKRQWAQTKNEVMKLNSNSNSKAKFGLNFTADLLDEEMAQLLGASEPQYDEYRLLSEETEHEGRMLFTPGGRNWVTSGNMYPVKNQG